jgi:tRNA dimethylallyltransferase
MFTDDRPSFNYPGTSLSDGSDAADVVPVICGPTAAGKSAIAARLAAKYKRPILVADSRQVYRRLDIGTAKPTASEREGVPHFGLDLVDPSQRFSAARWAEMAEGELAGTDRERVPLVVGGTGMYLRALFEGLFVDPTADDHRRGAVLDWLDTLPTDRLREWASELDPDRAGLGRTQLLRAVAVALLTGTRISRLYETHAREPRWRPRYLVVDPGPALHQRIEHRLDSMLGAGWLDEVRSLGDLADDAPAWKATGYRTLRDVVRGDLSMDEARERILIETRQYAKRQRTWFRHQLPDDVTTRVNPDAPGADAAIASWWEDAPSQ